MSVGLFDGLMVSHIKGTVGDAPLTAVNYVDQVSNLIIQLFFAFGTGGAVITSQFIGGGKIEEANKSAKQLIVLMGCFSLFITVFCLALNKQIINLFFGALDRTTLEYAYRYFSVTTLSYPFLALFYGAAALLRAERKSLFTMLSAGMSFFINIGFNALFIYVCNLDVLGAGLGSLIARASSCVFLLAVLSRKNNSVRVNLFEKYRFDASMMKKISKLAIPTGIENSFFQLGKILVLSFISLNCYNIMVGDVAINYHSSANSVAMSINTVGCVVGNGINTSALTVIGQAVGTGIVPQVKYYIKKMMTISFIGNGISVLIVWTLSPFLINTYGVTPEASALAMKLLNICFAFQLVTYPLSFGLPSVLKANSDVRYVMAVSVTSMIIMRVGLCFVLTTDLLPFRLGAMGLWIGMISDWVLRAICFLIRLISGKWKKSSGLLVEGDATETSGNAS